MRHFIFITSEGYTYPPDSNTVQSNVENCQVLGFGEGNEISEAFEKLVKENPWLSQTTFDQVTAYELECKEIAGEFYLQSNH